MQRMTLLDLALSAARQLPQGQIRDLLLACEQKVIEDGVYNLFEMMLLQSIRRHLGVASGMRSPAAVSYQDVASLRCAFQTVLSAMAALGSDNEPARDAAFELGWSRLEAGKAKRMDVAEIPVMGIETALHECEQGSAVLRGRLLESCVTVMEMDGVMTELEISFLRATADAIGVSFPTFDKTSALNLYHYARSCSAPCDFAPQLRFQFVHGSLRSSGSSRFKIYNGSFCRVDSRRKDRSVGIAFRHTYRRGRRV
jgi:hypothetical protein